MTKDEIIDSIVKLREVDLRQRLEQFTVDELSAYLEYLMAKALDETLARN